MLARLAFPLMLAVPAFLQAAYPTTITLHSSPTTAEYGRAVTLTAVVSPARATGQVTFYDGAAVLETEPLTNGKATFTTVLLPSGANSLKAYYGGDSTFGPSTSAVVIETVKTVESRGLTAPTYTYTNAPYFKSVAVGDLNGDGNPDIAIVNQNINGAYEAGVSIFLGKGDGTFQSPVNYGPSSSPLNLAIGDFLGNGNADLVVDGFPTMSLFYGNGDGTFQPGVSAGVVGYYPVVADFNADGKADIAATYNGNLVILLGNGSGGFQQLVTPEFGFYPTVLKAGDFNGDGKVDLVACNGGYLSILLGNGDGTFQAPSNFIADNGPQSLVIADFNGDGKLDLAAGNSEIAVLLGNGDGTFQPAVYYPGSSSALAAIDFNGDGKVDLLTPESVFLGNGDGTFQPAVNFLWPYYGANMAAGDFNSDGRVDVVTSDLSVQLGTIAGPTTTTLSVSPYPSFVGESVTLTATVSPSTSGGTMTFYSNSVELGATTFENGTATFKTTALPVFYDGLSATYGGGPYAQPSTGYVEELVNPAPTSTTLLSSPNPSTVGQTVTLTAAIAPAAATGSVTFMAGAIALGTSTISNGMAVLNISTLPKGSHALTATYLGSPSYNPSVSAYRDQVVN